jgi:hypothetical protein
VRDRRERLLTQFEESDGCWLWTGAIVTGGYGQITVATDRTLRAHRAMWMLHHDRIVPIGMTLDHLCRVRRCVNPKHLEPVTIAENVRRAALERDAGANIRVRFGPRLGPRYVVGFREMVAGKERQRTRTFGTMEDAEDFRREIIERRALVPLAETA